MSPGIWHKVQVASPAGERREVRGRAKQAALKDQRYQHPVNLAGADVRPEPESLKWKSATSTSLFVQPQRGPGGWCGSVCWPMSLMGSAHAPRARARVSGNAFDFFSLHLCASCQKCKAADVFHLAIAPRNPDNIIRARISMAAPQNPDQVSLHPFRSPRVLVGLARPRDDTVRRRDVA